jgi:hypothetical protein
MAFLVQFTASLLAILVLAWFARRLGLGRDARIRDEEHAQLLADEVVNGFEALRTAVDEFGRAALLQDAAGRVILVKLHGAQFSGRLLGPEAEALIWNDLGERELQVSSGEWLFGKASLNIADPDDWAKAVKTAKEPAHA